MLPSLRSFRKILNSRLPTAMTMLVVALFVLLSSSALAEEVVLKDQHPTEYTVTKGDTLWDIASRFLRDPWRWPDIWYVNPQIENPHLIYPGDQVVLTYKDGKPQLELRRGTTRRTIKLSPTVRKEVIDPAIPTIPLEAISQFLSRPRVLNDDQLQGAPYIVAFEDKHLVAGAGNTVFVRGLYEGGGSRYTVFRTGKIYKDTPARGSRPLGIEAIYVAEALLKQQGDPASMEITESSREVLIGDRLFTSRGEVLDFNFVPHSPSTPVEGNIIDVVDGISRVGQFQVVVINLGLNDGMEPGHVLAVFQQGQTVEDKTGHGVGGDVRLPDKKAGYLMVFRPFEKVSYALIMKSYRDMRLYDMLKRP